MVSIRFVVLALSLATFGSAAELENRGCPATTATYTPTIKEYLTVATHTIKKYVTVPVTKTHTDIVVSTVTRVYKEHTTIPVTKVHTDTVVSTATRVVKAYSTVTLDKVITKTEGQCVFFYLLLSNEPSNHHRETCLRSPALPHVSRKLSVLLCKSGSTDL
jgi:hypothetical protein